MCVCMCAYVPFNNVKFSVLDVSSLLKNLRIDRNSSEFSFRLVRQSTKHLKWGMVTLAHDCRKIKSLRPTWEI